MRLREGRRRGDHLAQQRLGLGAPVQLDEAARRAAPACSRRADSWSSAARQRASAARELAGIDEADGLVEHGLGRGRRTASVGSVAAGRRCEYVGEAADQRRVRGDAALERQRRRRRLEHEHRLRCRARRALRRRRRPRGALRSSSIELSVTGPTMPRAIGSSNRVVPSILSGTPFSRSTPTAAAASGSFAPSTPCE